MTKKGTKWAKNLPEEERIALIVERADKRREQARLDAQRNKTKIAAKKYGIEESELLALIEEANGICCLCTAPLGESLHIDHCHKTNKVRKVLCARCNNGLGQFKDNIETLERAIVYLKAYL